MFTCEHGGNQVPRSYSHLFKGGADLLKSHRGYDPGALDLAKAFSKHFRAPLFSSKITRLLIELNRSQEKNLFSLFTESLSEELKDEIKAKYYFPYRFEVESEISRIIKMRKRVIHISVHTFTPMLGKVIRRGDIGLLYDPSHDLEKKFCLSWQKILMYEKCLLIRRNYPYLGKSDGFTTYLRSLFPENEYLGIEIEVNQKFYLEEKNWKKLLLFIVNSLSKCNLS